MSAQSHEVTILTRLNKETGKWEVYVQGVTFGAEIGGGDELTVKFYLDASRFTPVIRIKN